MPFLMMFQKASSFDPPITAISAAIATIAATSAVVASSLQQGFHEVSLSVSSQCRVTGGFETWVSVHRRPPLPLVTVRILVACCGRQLLAALAFSRAFFFSNRACISASPSFDAVVPIAEPLIQRDQPVAAVVHLESICGAGSGRRHGYRACVSSVSSSLSKPIWPFTAPNPASAAETSPRSGWTG